MSTLTASQPSRRDFLQVSTAALAVGGVAAIAWPLVDQMNPDSTIQAFAAIEVDLSAIAVGQIVIVKWRGGPVFVRRRTAKEIELVADTDVSSLRKSANRRAARSAARVVDRFGDLHPPGLCSNGTRRRLSGLVMPLPRLSLRRLGSRAPRPRAAQPARSRIQLPQLTEEIRYRLKRIDSLDPSRTSPRGSVRLIDPRPGEFAAGRSRDVIVS